MKLSTIGFTKKSTKRFFELLRASGAKRVVDVRLNNVSQLAERLWRCLRLDAAGVTRHNPGL
jgi:hypothetical protein